MPSARPEVKGGGGVRARYEGAQGWVRIKGEKGQIRSCRGLKQKIEMGAKKVENA